MFTKNRLHLHGKCHTSFAAALGHSHQTPSGKAGTGLCPSSQGGTLCHLSKPQAQKKPERQQPRTGFCQRGDSLSGFKPHKVLPRFLSRCEVQVLFPNSKLTHHHPWKAKGEMCCSTLLDPMHCWPEGRPALYTMTPLSAHDTINWSP